ncbi:uncharacterized protein BDW47DRAFT_129844 [Aspergillus candidus]|uniref:Integral membrane protein, Mpv17/PMP22 family n=1 Tax=Aspergillus candidus TaxID=41067 RepID=A0A2I2EYU1_ASPCN|nr:hypothetical protein BDW47DRAFT_129844 [Aspergillus candidus]PLB33547.1 hypothetical protein BDW47DRAFT_129844 [Aspergillus candidus]
MPPSPLTVTLIQATILNAISNILAQIIDQYQKNKPFALNTPALLQFVGYAIIIVPINDIWQKLVEAWYPGFPTWRILSRYRRETTTATTTTNIPLHHHRDAELAAVAEEKDKPVRRAESGPGSGTWNFTMKFMLDQTVGSVMNIVLFVVLINLLKGAGWNRSWELVCEDFTPIMIARLKYRPLVSVLMYTIVPLDRRVVFGSACGVIWSVYLSLYAAV